MSDRFYTPRTQRGIYGNIWAWVIGILVLVLVVIGIVGIVRWASAPARGKLQAREQINSGATRISAYEMFFNRCAAIQGMEAALKAQKALLPKVAGEERERVNTNIAGITAARAASIAQYNVDAAKSYTIGQFRASALPYSLDLNGEVTVCTAG